MRRCATWTATAVVALLLSGAGANAAQLGCGADMTAPATQAGIEDCRGAAPSASMSAAGSVAGDGQAVVADLPAAAGTSSGPAATAAPIPVPAPRPRRTVAAVPAPAPVAPVRRTLVAVTPAPSFVPPVGKPATVNRRCSNMLCPLYVVIGNGY